MSQSDSDERSKLHDDSNLHDEGNSMKPKSHIPAGFHTVNSYLIVEGAAKLMEFAKQVFGAEEVLRISQPDGKVGHAEIRIGDSVIETADACEAWKAMPASLHVYVPDADATYRKALEAGAESLSEPSDKFYGERSASVRDAAGNVWHIATLIEELTKTQMLERAATFQAEQAQQKP